LERWPTVASACSLAAPDGSTASLAGNSWWSAWKPYVFYGLAPAYSADGTASGCDSASCIDAVDPAGRLLASSKRFAVIVAGPALVRDGFVQHRDAAAIAEIASWLEESNAKLEGSAGCGDEPPPFACEGTGTCGRVTMGAATRTFNDVVVAWP